MGGAWWHEAACAGVEVELFFDYGRGLIHDRKRLLAKQICGACPVKLCCLAEALSAPEQHGIWGGLDEDERSAMKQRMRSR